MGDKNIGDTVERHRNPASEWEWGEKKWRLDLEMRVLNERKTSDVVGFLDLGTTIYPGNTGELKRTCSVMGRREKSEWQRVTRLKHKDSDHSFHGVPNT